MKLKSILYFLTGLGLVFFLACERKGTITINKNATRFTKFPTTVNVKFEDVFEYKKGTPLKMVLLDSILAIFNYRAKTNRFFYKYNLKGKQFIGDGLIDEGKGPHELIGAVSANYNGSSFWIYDITIQKILMFPKDEILSKNLSFKEYYLRDMSYFKILMLDDHRFLGTAPYHNHDKSVSKIQEINAHNGKLLNEFGEFGDTKNIPIELAKRAANSDCFLHPKKNKVAVAYLYQDVLEIYDLDKPFKCKAIQGPNNFLCTFRMATIGDGKFIMQKLDNTAFAFDLSGSTTEDYIYLGYYGSNYKEMKKLDLEGAKSIFIYDWEGNPIKRLNFDKRIGDFVVSQDNKIIYAYDTERGFIVKAAIK